MAILDDSILDGGSTHVQVVQRAGRRRITHVVHDIDGTHSLIRDWPPVMSLSVHYAMVCGLDEDFDSAENLAALIARVGAKPLAETDEFCIESAGLSALTQMEYGIRRGVELGHVPPGAFAPLSQEQIRRNSEVIRRIWMGRERFDDIDEPADLLAFIAERTPRLFRLYEAVLNGACRDRNTAEARVHPEKFLVPGSMEFVLHLREIGCVNLFVTGAVVYPTGGMFEEVMALGFEIGPGKLIDEMLGSSWDRKMPKDEVMRELCETRGIDPAEVLVIGDGRTEIAAGVKMGSVTMSRLNADATRQRELHIGFGTNYIVPDFTDPMLTAMIGQE